MALAWGTHLTQEPWLEKDWARLWGHGPVLGGLKGHSFALGSLRYLVLPRWRRQKPTEQTWNHTLSVGTQGLGPAGGHGMVLTPGMHLRTGCFSEAELVGNGGELWFRCRPGLGQPSQGGGRFCSVPCPSCSVPLQRHPARELVVQATTVFGNLQSFMKQALDQAVATQAVWHTLSSRPRVRARPEQWSGRGSHRVARAACRGPQLPHVEGGWWLNQGAVRSPCLAVLTHLFAEDLLGRAMSWPSGRTVSEADPLSWDVTRCPQVPTHYDMYCSYWRGQAWGPV